MELYIPWLVVFDIGETKHASSNTKTSATIGKN